LAANALTLERSPQLIVPAKDIVAVKRSLLPAPAIVRASSLDGLGLASFLPGMNPGFMFGSAAAAAPAATVVFKTRGRDATTQSQYQVLDVNIEAAAGNKTVIVAFNYGSGSVGAVDFVTIEGVTATQLTSVNNGGAQVVAIYSAEVSTATADLVIDLANTENRLMYAVWVAYNLQNPTTIVDQDSTITDAATITLNTTADGIAIAYACARANGTSTWTGVTENFEEQGSFDGAGQTDTGGSAQTPSTGTLGISADLTGTTQYTMAAVTLR
jgi:hypothetical protein